VNRQADTTFEEWGVSISMLRHGDRLELKFHAHTMERPETLQVLVDSLAALSGLSLAVEAGVPQLLEKTFQTMDFLTTLHDLVIEVAPEMSPFSQAGGRA
jgi:hypothetical protein